MVENTITPIPAFGVSGLVQVTDQQLAEFAQLIYARTGIRVSPQKKTLLSNRLRRRLRETGIETFEDLLATAEQTENGVLFAFGGGDELFLLGTRLAALDRDSFSFY